MAGGGTPHLHIFLTRHIVPPPSRVAHVFDSPGRAEPIRLALTGGHTSFEDERIGSNAFATLIADSRLPFKCLPTVNVDGEVLDESNAILRFAGKPARFHSKCGEKPSPSTLSSTSSSPPLPRSIQTRPPTAARSSWRRPFCKSFDKLTLYFRCQLVQSNVECLAW